MNTFTEVDAVGRRGKITLRVDGTEAAVGRLAHTASFTFGHGDALIGRDTSTAFSTSLPIRSTARSTASPLMSVQCSYLRHELFSETLSAPNAIAK